MLGPEDGYNQGQADGNFGCCNCHDEKNEDLTAQCLVVTGKSNASHWAVLGITSLIISPLGYLDFLSLQEHASLVLTDSGGIQEETTYLGVPCLTARPNTERPLTISMGTNQLVESESTALVQAMQASLSGSRPKKKSPPLWDGHTAGRIVKVFRQA